MKQCKTQFEGSLFLKARTWSMALLLGMYGVCSVQPYSALPTVVA